MLLWIIHFAAVMHNICLCAQTSLRHSLSRHYKRITQRNKLWAKQSMSEVIVIVMLCLCSADVKTDESESLNQGRLTLTVHPEARSLYSGAAVTLMFLAYSLSTHKLQGGLFIDLSLFSASTSVAFFPPFNGLIFLELCCYYLLCIFEVQITLRQIINFSKSGFISRPMSAPKYSFMFENSAEDHCCLTFLEFF